MRLLLESFSFMFLLRLGALYSNTLTLPPPNPNHSVVNPSKVIGWREHVPIAPAHFIVSKFAEGLKNSRWIYAAPDGNIFVAESQAGRITRFRDSNNDGVPEIQEIFLSGLRLPFGMLLLNNWFYVANTNALWRYPYKNLLAKKETKGEKVLDLPSGGNHWTRNIIASKKGNKIYISIGSFSNIAEDGIQKEDHRANIIELNPDGTGARIFASGLRNPVGLGLAPEGHALWTSVNERDNLGEDLVPDFLTEVSENGFYGWPYFYWGKNPDPRLKGPHPDLTKKSLEPSVSLGAHVAPLGLAFYHHTKASNLFPIKYQNGAFVGLHGSWNRSILAGYKVVFVPFKNGKASGPPEDFLTGFVANSSKSEVYGRPAGVAVLSDGSLLVADDASNILWKVTYKK
ncbi:MAG: sorbosone dehydrogenase family protein [Bacteriovorax sp.]|nr:sorbosone dehydrogenase family protein [Bacteriovorax sp.]